MSILDDIKGKRLFVAASHADDESLFCGGLLLAAKNLAKEITVLIATDISDTNRHSDPEKEPARALARMEAFRAVQAKIGFQHFLADVPNLKPGGGDTPAHRSSVAAATTELLCWIFSNNEYDIVLTHGVAAEYGHKKHSLLHHAVRAAWPGPVWCFSTPAETGSQDIEIDRAGKLELLEFYNGPGHPSGKWEAAKEYPQYTTGTETFLRVQ